MWGPVCELEKTVRNKHSTNVSDVKRVEYLLFPFFLFIWFFNNELCQVGWQWCLDSSSKRDVCYDEDLSAQRRSAVWTVNTTVAGDQLSLHRRLRSKCLVKHREKEAKQQLLYEWISQKRREWQSQTSLFLSLIQVTYCKIDYSTNFPLLCCLYCTW